MRHQHKWVKSRWQDDTGRFGVRLYCSVKEHILTVHRNLLEKYLNNTSQ